LRRSALVSLQIEQLTLEGDDSGSLLLERSKTDQEGDDALLYVSVHAIEYVLRSPV